MKTLFSRLSVTVVEDAQFKILLKNILPFYQTQLGLSEVESVAELVRFGKILEARKASVEAYFPQPLRGRSLEPDLDYVDSGAHSSRGPGNVSSVAPPSYFLLLLCVLAVRETVQERTRRPTSACSF
ncbi:hypothetical protein QE152_g6953 [Popillia japonica]|uniref:Uncharacterized protein n=1 Tax=Popillia japonica TaxID=7064 RepID=A0AAW1MFN1_POPJA